MAGAVAIVIVLLLIPVAVLMSGAVGAAVFGELFHRHARSRAASHELLDIGD